MIRKTIAPVAILASTIAAFAAPADSGPADKQLRIYPKNLARHHVGANVFHYNTTSQSFTTTEAAAAWLDEDITTGWAPMAGKQHYLIALPEPEVVTNFCVSAKAGNGKVTLYGGDEPAAPGDKSWVPLVREASLDSINGKKLAKPISRLTKYVLIETDIADPGPLFSLYLYGERPAVSYTLTKREQPLDTKAVFGPFTNDLTAFSQSSLYSGGRVHFSTDKSSYTSWQKAIDDNPESAVSIVPTKDDAGMALTMHASHKVSRIALLTGAGAKGKLEVFLAAGVPSASPAITSADADAAVQPVSNAPKVATSAVPLSGLTPAATFELDGSDNRVSQDFAGTDASAILLRWTPANGSDSLVLHELAAFDGMSLADYGLGLTPDAVAELAEDASKDGKSFADGKGGPGKGLEPVGELFPRRKPYLPPTLGFPPPIPPRIPPNIPPTPLSN